MGRASHCSHHAYPSGTLLLVTVLAHDLIRTGSPSIPSTAWYVKTIPTFSDALALVRKHLWNQASFPTSLQDTDGAKVPRSLLNHLVDLLCYAA